MSRRPSRPGQRGPRVPTWALALVVIAALGGAAWLFWGDLTSDNATDTTTEPKQAEPVDESADELSLPDDEEPTDERRRGDEGRDRLDSDIDAPAGTDDGETADDADDLPDDLPPAYASLRERRIAVLPASAEGTGNVARLVRVQGLRVPCATPGAKDALTVELAMATLASERLTSAMAVVAGAQAERFGAATCVDARVATFADADVALVLRVTPAGDASRVIVGRPTGEPDANSVTLAAEIAAALDLGAVTPAKSAAVRTLLANAGAIDAPGGASVVLVEVPAVVLVEDGALETLVDDVVGGVAAHLARADLQTD